MTDYFVASGGDNSDGLTWAKAKTSIAGALTLATADGDRVIIQYDGIPSADAEVSSATTWTATANISIITSTNSGTATVTPTAMGTGSWIGNSTTNKTITLASTKAIYVYGLTMRTSGSTEAHITINSGTTGDFTLDNCYLWNGNSNAASYILIGATAAGRETATVLTNSTLRFGATGQGIDASASIDFEGCAISSSGSTPTTLFVNTVTTNLGYIRMIGCDLSLITGTLIGDQTGGPHQYYFSQCKLGAGVTVLAAQTTNPHHGAGEAYVIDCDSGDNHYQFQHYNALGSLTADTAIYANDGAAYVSTPTRYSWKIVTTANAGFANPYVSPWLTVHHEGTSAITPNLECVRSGSATAYKDDEVWTEFLYKGTSGFTTGTIDRTDRRAIAGTGSNQTTGALGAGDWTGENATSWFGKLAPASAITPAEIGDLCARVCMGVASQTVYVDPQIRGRS